MPIPGFGMGDLIMSLSWLVFYASHVWSLFQESEKLWLWL
jgi:hypothetical protein